MDEKLKPLYCRALRNYESALAAYEKEAKEAELEKPNYDACRKKFEEFVTPSISKFWMFFWLVFFCIAEFPLNSIIFQILGENLIFTSIVAATVCVGIPIAAHLVGKSIRQENKNTIEKIWIILLPLIVIGAITYVAIFRTVYFEANKTVQALHLKINPNTLTIVFVIINLLIFIIATIISYEGTHPRHREYKSAKKRYKNALKSLKKESEEADAAAKILNDANDKLQNRKTCRKKKHEGFCERARIIKSISEGLIHTYRQSNLFARKTNDIPVSFKTALNELIIPDSLIPEKLDWNCDEETVKTSAV